MSETTLILANTSEEQSWFQACRCTSAGKPWGDLCAPTPFTASFQIHRLPDSVVSPNIPLRSNNSPTLSLVRIIMIHTLYCKHSGSEQGDGFEDVGAVYKKKLSYLLLCGIPGGAVPYVRMFPEGSLAVINLNIRNKPGETSSFVCCLDISTVENRTQWCFLLLWST